jgi:hypothetical protein
MMDFEFTRRGRSFEEKSRGAQNAWKKKEKKKS